MKRPVVILFARVPRLGQVKTRLAKYLGHLPTLQLYKTLLAHAEQIVVSARWDSVLALTPDYGFHQTALPVLPQGRGDLGERMARAFGTFPDRAVIIVGSDIPQMTATHVAQAIKKLGQYQMVLGPSLDGGFWLVGFQRGALAGNIFDSVRWSTSFARTDVLEHAKHLSVAELETLRDLDDVDDLKALLPNFIV